MWAGKLPQGTISGAYQGNRRGGSPHCVRVDERSTHCLQKSSSAGPVVHAALSQGRKLRFQEVKQQGHMVRSRLRTLTLELGLFPKHAGAPPSRPRWSLRPRSGVGPLKVGCPSLRPFPDPQPCPADHTLSPPEPGVPKGRAWEPVAS